MAIASTDPSTGEIWRRFDAESADVIERKLQIAAAQFAVWRRTSIDERAATLRRVATLLDAEVEQAALLMTREMGKTIRAARDEAKKCAMTCRFYADEAERMLAGEAVDGDEQRVQFDPLGPVLAIMPWNFPFWQVIRFAAPALVAGNVALLKHASNVPGCALYLEQLFERAGAPGGVFQTMLIEGGAVASLIADRRIVAVTLTGSDAAGRCVGATAGAHLKPSVLELGGSDAFIVLPSAELNRAVDAAVAARVINNGQSCIAAKRFIVADELYDDFLDAFVAQMRALRVGDPKLDSTDVGPLATRAIRDEVARQVDELQKSGSRLILGGVVPEGVGNYYPPTVVDSIASSAAVAREEIFGPVALVFRAKTPEHALELANNSDFGLGASVWTRNREQARYFARELEVGTVAINAVVASDPRFPFGGIKASGYGRELSSYGLREFVNVKTVRGEFEP